MSTRLIVEHLTTYRYARPVTFSEHRIMFRPRAAHDIRVLATTLEVSPLARVRWIHDVFSNSVALVELLEPSDTLTFRAAFEIEHFGVENFSLPVEPYAENYPFDYPDEDRINLAPYLHVQYPEDTPALRDWLKPFLPERGQIHTRNVLQNITEAIREDFRYAAREAMGTQRPAETLAGRSGTCRDFALLMIEAVRALGLAARFVSGYLYDTALDTPEKPAAQGSGEPQSQIRSFDVGTAVLGSGATHAWLQVFLPGAGWVPFDPTNTLYGGTDLIRVAYTRTPEQAAPVSGGWFGAAGDFQGMSVEVSVRRGASPDAAVTPEASPASAGPA